MAFCHLVPLTGTSFLYIVLYGLIIAPLFLAVKIFFYEKTANFIAK